MSANRNSSREQLRMLCRIAVMAALYVVLSSFLAIRLGNLRITFASLPTTLMAVLFGPQAGALTALTGELVNQIVSYGFGPTTLLWVLPPVFRAAAVGAFASLLATRDTPPEGRPLPYTAALVAAALLTTAVNTLVIWLDSVIGGYYSFAYVFGQTGIRLVNGVLTAVAVAIASIALLRALRGRI